LKNTNRPQGNSWTSPTSTPCSTGGAGGVGVGDDELQALHRPGLGLHDPGADRDRARRARRRELHEAHLVADPVVVVGVEADLST
jgi:hypothetical protein